MRLSTLVYNFLFQSRLLTFYSSRTPSSWDPHDDMMLRHLKEQQKLGWKEIAAHFPNRTTNACQFRWRRLKSGTLRSSGSSGSSSSSPSGTASASSSGNTSSHSSNNHDLSRQLVSGLPTSVSANDTTIFRTAYPEPGTRNWSRDEDELILSRSDLRVEELSLLLPQRNETEIWHRRTELANYQNYHPHRYSYQPQQQPAQGYTPQPGLVHLSNNYAVSSMSSGYSTARRSSVDPVTLVQPNPSVLQSSSSSSHLSSSNPSSSSRQPPKLHSKKNTHFDNLRLPPPVSQRPPH